ncbi:glycine-rich extracellular protein 1 [Cynocephalus volans]|uniref:glycine-rich extracellular protein 1 n=1 Tax=Cynocephalus volans TaxID=110931 RepID=UPI002FCB86C2
MGTLAFPMAFFLLCLTLESVQGGYGPPSGLGAGFWIWNGLGAQPGPPAQYGYGAGRGIGAGVKPQKPGFGNGDGLEAGALPGAVTQPGFGSRNGLGVCAFPGAGTLPGLGGGMKPQKPGIGGGTKPQKLGSGGGMKPQEPGYGNGVGLGTPEPGFGGGRKPQKLGETHPLASQPGLTQQTLIHQTSPGPQQPGYGGGVKAQKPGFGNGSMLGAQPSRAAQNGFGAGFREGVKSQKPGYGNRLGTGAFPGPGTQPGHGNGNGLGARPGLEVNARPQKPGPVAQDSYGLGYGEGRKSLKPGFGNRNGLGAQSEEAIPGLLGSLEFTTPPFLPLQVPAVGGVAPLFLPRPATPEVPSDNEGDWGLKSQPPPPVQNGKFPGYRPPNGYGLAVSPGFACGLKPQKVGFGYGTGVLEAGVFPEACPQPGFPGAHSFRNGYGEEALVYPKAAPAPEEDGQARALWGSPWPALQPWGSSSKPGYAAGGTFAGVRSQPGLYGQLRSELGPGPFGEGAHCARAAPGLKDRCREDGEGGGGAATDGDWLEPGEGGKKNLPERADVSDWLLRGEGGCRRRARGPGAAAAKLAAPLPRSRSHLRLARARSRLGRARPSLPPTPPPAPSLPHPPLPCLPPGLSPAPPPPPLSALALAELPPLPALPLRPELPTPWGPGAHLALPELTCRACPLPRRHPRTCRCRRCPRPPPLPGP